MIRTIFNNKKNITRINTGLPVIDTNKVYYKFIDGAVRALKLVDAYLTYKWNHKASFATVLTIRYKVAGLKDIQEWCGGYHTCGWRSFMVSETISDCIESKTIDIIPHYNTEPSVGKYGKVYVWNGRVAEETYGEDTVCLINLITREEIYIGFGVECYLTKQECENDNKVKVVLFDDEENDNDREERMEFDKDLIKKMMRDFIGKYNVSELTLTIKKA